MTSHASRKTKHFPPRLWNPFLITTLPTAALRQPSPFPSPGPENSPTPKMRATREKSHSQLGGPTCGDTWGLGIPGSPSHLAKSSWKEDLLCARASPGCHEEISLNVPSRGNCIPKGVTSPQIGLLDSKTNTTKSQPAHCSPAYQERKDLHVENVGQPRNMGILLFPFSRFSTPALLCSSPVPLTSFHGPRKVALAHHAPCVFGARRGFWVDHSWGNRQPWKLPRMLRVRVGLFLSEMTDAHAHAHTHTPSLWHLHTYPHTQEIIGFVKTHCST